MVEVYLHLPRNRTTFILNFDQSVAIILHFYRGIKILSIGKRLWKNLCDGENSVFLFHGYSWSLEDKGGKTKSFMPLFSKAYRADHCWKIQTTFVTSNSSLPNGSFLCISSISPFLRFPVYMVVVIKRVNVGKNYISINYKKSL